MAIIFETQKLFSASLEKKARQINYYIYEREDKERHIGGKREGKDSFIHSFIHPVSQSVCHSCSNDTS